MAQTAPKAVSPTPTPTLTAGVAADSGALAFAAHQPRLEPLPINAPEQQHFVVAARTPQPDLGPDSHHAPAIGAARVGLSQTDEVAEADVVGGVGWD